MSASHMHGECSKIVYSPCAAKVCYRSRCQNFATNRFTVGAAWWFLRSLRPSVGSLFILLLLFCCFVVVVSRRGTTVEDEGMVTFGLKGFYFFHPPFQQDKMAIFFTLSGCAVFPCLFPHFSALRRVQEHQV